MNNLNQEIALNLIKMVEFDYIIREKLALSGELYQGYHPVMEQVHNQNAEYLEKVIAEIGWPTEELVGEEGAYAAWIILQHAISKPDFIRKTLRMLESLAKCDKISARKVAMLYDKIRFFEMKPQKYGTQFDLNEHNELVPWKLENEQKVDSFRRQVGLPPLSETISFMQKHVNKHEIDTLEPYKKRQKERMKWAKQVGWI